MLKWIFSFLMCLLVSVNAWASPHFEKSKRDTAYYYGDVIPLQEAALYPRIVLEPKYVESWHLNWLSQRNTQVYARISLASFLDTGLVNAGSDLNNKANSLIALGYHGVYLDGLDGLNLGSNAQTLAMLVRQLSKRFDERVIVNGGLAFAGQLQGLVHSLVVNLTQEETANLANNAGLLANIRKAQALGHQVQLLSYAKGLDDRTALAQKISRLGLSVWLADPKLNTWGTSELIPVPRKIMVLYDGDLGPSFNTDVHQNLDVVMEYLGYMPVYVDIKTALPEFVDPALYAGMIYWANTAEEYTPQLSRWLVSQVSTDAIRLLLLGAAPNNESLLALYGLSIGSETKKAQSYSLEFLEPKLKGQYPIEWAHHSSMHFDFKPRHDAEIWLATKAPQGKRYPQVVRSKYGAIALYPWIFDGVDFGADDWVMDPFFLLEQGLGLRKIPAPDVTTENGLRSLMIHIDGDGFPYKAFYPGTPTVTEVVMKEVLDKYRLPTTVSIVEAEISSQGLYAKNSSELENIARELMRKDYVELASHTFSHPFKWERLFGAEERTPAPRTVAHFGLNLKLREYKPSLEREIAGSINYINTRLAPANKKVKMMLWSGDALINSRALELTEQMGVLNVNGGSNFAHRERPSVSTFSAIARTFDKGRIQVYAPSANEVPYTAGGARPDYKFRAAVDTFKFTEHPRRLKPMNIYYHFYSGTYPGGIKALHQIYDYALEQEHTTMHLSDYTLRAMDFYQSALAQDHDGNWLIQSQSLRTLRVPNKGMRPDEHSLGVIGQRKQGDQRYLHLVGADPVLSVNGEQSRLPQLHSVNAVVEQWQPKQQGVDVEFIAHEATELKVLSSAKQCRLLTAKKRWSAQAQRGLKVFSLPAGRYKGQLLCGS